LSTLNTGLSDLGDQADAQGDAIAAQQQANADADAANAAAMASSPDEKWIDFDNDPDGVYVTSGEKVMREP